MPSVPAGKSALVSAPACTQSTGQERGVEPAVHVPGRPRFAELFDLHRPVVAVVLDPEGDGALRGARVDRNAERVQAPAAVLGRDLRRDQRGLAEQAQGRGGVERAAEARNAAVNAIQRDEPDDAELAHVYRARDEGEGEGERRERGAAGEVARPGTSPTASIHQAGPVGWIHW